tara:strand:+ start:206 stop:424 length:219 start_codon:yes stop_codon:yes gene_type:complete
MKIENLEDKVIDLQNVLMSNYIILDELWSYHPANENFINPVKSYDEMKLVIKSLEDELRDIQEQIHQFNSLN